MPINKLIADEVYFENDAAYNTFEAEDYHIYRELSNLSQFIISMLIQFNFKNKVPCLGCPRKTTVR